MTPFQRKLARHALGLPNTRHSSYRNRYLAGDPHVLRRWRGMVENGEAVAGETKEWGSQWFSLTLQGAKAALEPREHLCPEDFPAVLEDTQT